MTAPHSFHRLLRLLFVLVLASYVILGVVYSIILPIWESPDEPEHLLYVRYLATHRALPDVPLISANFTGNDEGGQAPLYYILGALLTSSVDMGDLDALRINPYRTWPDHPAGRAQFEHTQDERFPWQRAVLAAHLVRLLAVALGAATLVCINLVARGAFPKEPFVAPLAMALAAFNPGFLASTAVGNNDAAVAFTSSLVLVLLYQAFAPGRSGSSGWWIGGALGLAFLSKANALILAPFCLMPAFVKAEGRRPGIRFSAKVVVGALLTSGWWFAWNVWRFGTPIRKEAELVIASHANWWAGLSPEALWRTGGTLFKSSWGFSGWTSLEMDDRAYLPLAVISLAGLIGLMMTWGSEDWWPPRQGTGFRLLLVALAAVFIGTVVSRVVITQLPGTDHARFLLPVAAAIVVPLARGLIEVGRAIRLAWLPAVLVGAVGCLAILSPWAYVLPAYPKALPIWRGTLPKSMPNQVSFKVGEDVELLGYRLSDSVRTGEDLRLTLFWRSRRDLEREYHVFVYLLDSRGKTVGQSDGQPTDGLYPTQRWHAGEVIADDRVVHIGAELPNGNYRLGVGMYSWPDVERLPVTVDGRERPDGIADLGTITVSAVSTLVSPP